MGARDRSLQSGRAFVAPASSRRVAPASSRPAGCRRYLNAARRGPRMARTRYMTRRSLFLLLFVAGVASADDIRFNPPSPDSQTHVVAYLVDPTACSPQSVTPVVDGSTILIKIVVPCLLPTCCPTPVSVDLGILPSGIYSVTATMNGSLLQHATLVVRDPSPVFPGIHPFAVLRNIPPLMDTSRVRAFVPDIFDRQARISNQ